MYRALAALIAMSTLVVPVAGAAEAPASVESAIDAVGECAGRTRSTWESQLFAALNAERASAGQPALERDACAEHVAGLRTDDLASRGYFSHTSPEGATAASLLEEVGRGGVASAENLARNNYPDGESVTVAVESLMASDGHRRAILHDRYTHGGVASALGEDGMRYYVMVFLAS